VAQDEESCVVFGMPKEAIKRAGVERSLPPGAVAHEIPGQLCVPEAVTLRPGLAGRRGLSARHRGLARHVRGLPGLVSAIAVASLRSNHRLRALPWRRP